MLLPRLKSLGVLVDRGVELRDPVHSLAAACDGGLLVGGLSVALDLTPDELLGPLAHAAGAALRILDVRGRVLTLQLGKSREELSWEPSSLEELIDLFNEQLRGEPAAKAVAVLGEWEEMLQLWCVEKRLLPQLGRERWFEPLNRAQLVGR
jgi:hypothetical protein